MTQFRKPHSSHPQEPATEKTFASVATPGVMISNAWPQSRMVEGETLSAIHSVFEDSAYFEALQIVDVPYAPERKAIAAFVDERHIPLTYTLTRIFAENNLNLSDLDSDNRKRSWQAVIERFAEAREAGASTIGVVSGPRPQDPGKRPQALAALRESLAHIAAALSADPQLQVLIEPLDFAAHKNFTLGSTDEAVAICRELEKEGIRLNLCLDTAHMILNGEEVIQSLEKARDHVIEFHLCNCVVDPGHPLHGDRHLPFGPPGVVNVGTIGKLMQQLRELDFLHQQQRPRVFCEVMLNESMTPIQVVRHCRESLEAAWKIASNMNHAQPPTPE